MSDTQEQSALIIGGEDYKLVTFEGLGTVYAHDDPIVSKEWAKLLTIRDKFQTLQNSDKSDDLRALTKLVDEWRDALASFITDGREHWDAANERGWLGVKNLARIMTAYAEYVTDGIPSQPS